jgi:isoquinoline 1-oxidoreductase alpha subunit
MHTIDLSNGGLSSIIDVSEFGRENLCPVVGLAEITTIEGIGGKAAEAVQTAWQTLDVVQCGYCQSGQIIAATALLRDNAKPTDEDISAAMSGNICRCATYHRIRAAIHEAARLMEA